MFLVAADIIRRSIIIIPAGGMAADIIITLPTAILPADTAITTADRDRRMVAHVLIMTVDKHGKAAMATAMARSMVNPNRVMANVAAVTTVNHHARPAANAPAMTVDKHASPAANAAAISNCRRITLDFRGSIHSDWSDVV